VRPFLFSGMLNIKYPVTEDRKTLMFKFFSEGPKGTIEKRIIYYKTKIPKVYGLGFGDKAQSGSSIDDFIVTNNGDTKKVLATVASTLYTFTEWFPNASIVAKGSTRSRNRLYRMNISNNYDSGRF
jgi:hypothetical protein